MEKSPSWEDDSRLTGQEIPRLLWNPEGLYRVQKRPSLYITLSQFNHVHTSQTDFDISPPSTLTSRKWYFFLQVFRLKFCIHFSTPHVPPNSRSWFYRDNNIPVWWPGNKNSPTVTHTCRKRRLKWVATLPLGDINTEAWSSGMGVWRGVNNPTL
jgi:hypothetical protein